MTASASLIVWEKSGRWAAAFRRAARPRELSIREVRGHEQVERELAEQPHSLAAIEVHETSLAQGLAQISTWRSRFPAARYVLLADLELAIREPELREAGACHVVYTSRDLAATVELVRRHLARAPQPDLTLEESILASLPWPSAKS